MKKPTNEFTIDEIIGLRNSKDKETVIELGNFIISLKKAVKRKQVLEYIIEHLKLDYSLCSLSIDVFDFLYLKEEINPNRFSALVKGYKEDGLKEMELCELLALIGSWQRDYNINHLKRFSQRLFGMSYQQIKAIKDDCYQRTYATYATVRIDKTGTTIVRKDGSIIKA